MVKVKFQTLIMLCYYLLVHKVNLKNSLFHLHDIDIDMVDKLHSLTNRGLGLEHRGLGSQVLGLDSQVLYSNTGMYMCTLFFDISCVTTKQLGSLFNVKTFSILQYWQFMKQT